jgi:prepilin-type processing-associated H-X9-DG protein
LNKARQQAQQIKCAANLKNIGLAMQIYSNNEKNNGFPRTYFAVTQSTGVPTPQTIDCTTSGGPATGLLKQASDANVPTSSIPPNSSASFQSPTTVPYNCVTASIFLLMKSTDLTPDIFVCPSSNANRGFTLNSPKDWSNFEDSPMWGQHMTYSFSCPFPGSTAVQNGFRWSSTVANPSDFALAADMNPGDQGGINPPNQVTVPTHTSGSKDIARANSNNHKNQGQNVLYADGHVQWQTSSFCGVACVTSTGAGYQDNIYTARTDFDNHGDVGFLDNSHFPCDGNDSYMLPTDDGLYGTTMGF